jgi:hypothetical protein
MGPSLGVCHAAVLTPVRRAVSTIQSVYLVCGHFVRNWCRLFGIYNSDTPNWNLKDPDSSFVIFCCVILHFWSLRPEGKNLAKIHNRTFSEICAMSAIGQS